jgi:hypothetical protein
VMIEDVSKKINGVEIDMIFSNFVAEIKINANNGDYDKVAKQIKARYEQMGKEVILFSSKKLPQARIDAIKEYLGPNINYQIVDTGIESLYNIVK